MFQILVYVGAVAVLIIFTVMLVRTQALFTTKEDKKRKGAGIALMLIIMSSLGLFCLHQGSMANLATLMTVLLSTLQRLAS